MGTPTGEIDATSVLPPVSGVEVEVRWIALSDLHDSPWNPRQYYPEASMRELTESMRASGFRAWLPLMVRPRPGGDGFEIGAGHRRRRAAQAAELEAAPCIVRPMTDAEFLDVLNFDNCNREDVHPLHESAGWQAWMEKTGQGVVDIAARIGQSKEYVYQRLKYSALINEARQKFLDGDITAGHAVLIARLQPPEQKKALKYCEPTQWAPDQKKSVRDLASFIQRDVHLDLESATFDLRDATLLSGAGSCEACPKRTKNSPDLVPIEALRAAVSPRPALVSDDSDAFEDDYTDAEESETEEDVRDECTDPGCFNMKLTNHLIRVKLQLESAGEAPIQVASGYGKAKKGLVSASEYSPVPAGTPGAKTAIVMDGHEAGKVIHVKVQPPPARKETWEEAQEKRKQQEAVERKKVDREIGIRLNIMMSITNKVTSLDRAALEAVISDALEHTDNEYVAALCRLHGIPIEGVKDWQVTAFLVGRLAKMSEVELFRLIVEISLSSDFKPYNISRKEPAEDLLLAAKRYKVDAVKVRSQAEEQLKEAEGGTRREVEKPATKKVPAAKAKPAKPATKKAAKKTVPAGRAKR